MPHTHCHLIQQAQRLLTLSADRNNNTSNNSTSSRSLTLQVLASMHVVTAQNHMHQADPPALLRILCVLAVALQATSGHAVGAVVAHKQSRNWKALQRSKVAATTIASNVAAAEQMW